ncbi:hypothetical protein RRF57_006303 [Xylaria bambusicola]|uniref:Uncharacterized protein n=1 Tax=Xylaria bambusicola TaxID=326684 RepID=A0AAN7UQ60_9PEZI
MTTRRPHQDSFDPRKLHVGWLSYGAINTVHTAWAELVAEAHHRKMVRLRALGVHRPPATIETLGAYDEKGDILVRLCSHLDVASILSLGAMNKKMRVAMKKIEPRVAEKKAMAILQDDDLNVVFLAFIAAVGNTVKTCETFRSIQVFVANLFVADSSLRAGYRLMFLPIIEDIHNDIVNFVALYWKASCFPLNSSTDMTPTEARRQRRYCYTLEALYCVFRDPIISERAEFKPDSVAGKMFNETHVERPSQALVKLLGDF